MGHLYEKHGRWPMMENTWSEGDFDFEKMHRELVDSINDIEKFLARLDLCYHSRGSPFFSQDTLRFAEAYGKVRQRKRKLKADRVFTGLISNY